MTDTTISGFISQLKKYLALIESSDTGVDEIIQAQDCLQESFLVLQEAALQKTGWSIPLIKSDDDDHANQASDGDIRAGPGLSYSIEVDIRERNPKKLRKRVAKRLLERGSEMDMSELQRLTTYDLITELMHGATADLADVLGDSARLTVHASNHSR